MSKKKSEKWAEQYSAMLKHRINNPSDKDANDLAVIDSEYEYQRRAMQDF